MAKTCLMMKRSDAEVHGRAYNVPLADGSGVYGGPHVPVMRKLSRKGQIRASEGELVGMARSIAGHAPTLSGKRERTRARRHRTAVVAPPGSIARAGGGGLYRERGGRAEKAPTYVRIASKRRARRTVITGEASVPRDEPRFVGATRSGIAAVSPPPPREVLSTPRG